MKELKELPENVKEAAGKIRWLGYAGFLIRDRINIYIDPVDADESWPIADVVVITHNHPRHCSVKDVERVSKPQTVIVGPPDCVCRFRLNQLPLSPGQKKSVLGVPLLGVAAYGLKGLDHPKAGGWIGCILELGGVRIYHPGDTDAIPELAGLAADIALLPVSDDLMDVSESVQLAARMNVRLAVPMHFNDENKSRAEDFIKAAERAGLAAAWPEKMGA